MSVYQEPVEWIRQSIDSIINQTFGNFEFIIINDNPSSNDNRIILRQYAGKDSRIVIISNVENIGLTKSLNKGLDIAKGEYIARMDADDISMPNRFEKQVDYLDKNVDVVALGTSAIIIDSYGKKRQKWRVKSDWHDLQCEMMFVSPILHPTAFFRRKINNYYLRYDETMLYSQDYALWSSIIKLYKINNLSEPLIYYRISDNQISSKNNKKQSFCAMRTIKHIMDNFDYNYNQDELHTLAFISKGIPGTLTPAITEKHLLHFILSNQNNFYFDNNITKRAIFRSYCNYLSIYSGFFINIAIILHFSLKAKVFSLYPFVSMIYKTLFRK